MFGIFQHLLIVNLCTPVYQKDHPKLTNNIIQGTCLGREETQYQCLYSILLLKKSLP